MSGKPREAIATVEGHRLRVDGMHNHNLKPEDLTRRRESLERMDQQLPTDSPPREPLIDCQTSQEHPGDWVLPTAGTKRPGCFIEVDPIRRGRVVASHAIAPRVDRQEGPLLFVLSCCPACSRNQSSKSVLPHRKSDRSMALEKPTIWIGSMSPTRSHQILGGAHTGEVALVAIPAIAQFEFRREMRAPVNLVENRGQLRHANLHSFCPLRNWTPDARSPSPTR